LNAGDGATAFIEGYAYGSLSMTAYGLGTSPAAPDRLPPTAARDAAALLPDPETVPPDDTNV